MRIITILLGAVLIAFAFPLPALAQDKSFSFEKLAPQDAFVIGAVPDGSPSIPAPPPEKPNFQVLRSNTWDLPGRKVTIHRVTEPVIPAPRQSPPPAASADGLGAFDWTFEIPISLSATVYADQLTFLHWRHDGNDYYAWSNVDFHHLSVAAFEVKGQRYSLYLGLGEESEDALKTIADKIPALPRNRPGFVLVGGPPPWVNEVPLVESRTDAEVPAIQGVVAIHELYATEGAKLQAAYLQRKQAEQERQAWLAANPPKPKDEEIHYWPLGATKNLEKAPGAKARLDDNVVQAATRKPGKPKLWPTQTKNAKP